MLVEEDARLFLSLSRELAAAGYRVERVSDSTQTVPAFTLAAPDVVVLDVVLPGVDALELARALRALSGVPILLLAARDGVDDRVAGLDAGADDYLPKPFAVEELLARLRALLRGRALAAAGAIAEVRLGTLVPGRFQRHRSHRRPRARSQRRTPPDSHRAAGGLHSARRGRSVVPQLDGHSRLVRGAGLPRRN